MVEVPRSVDVRSRVVVAAVDLFSERGFEATSVDDLARAAGLSRSTYFRQVGGKEDAVFADHLPLLEELGAWMDEQAASRPRREGTDPWTIVCRASERVFAHLSEDLVLARRRYRVVRDVQALRDREIITERRYEHLFADFLRRTVPGLDPVDAIGFAALVTATHNHFLRQTVRSDGGEPATQVTARFAAALDQALATVRLRFGVGGGAGTGPDAHTDAGPGSNAGSGPGVGRPPASQVIVASFPTTMPSGEVLRRVREALGAGSEG